MDNSLHEMKKLSQDETSRDERLQEIDRIINRQKIQVIFAGILFLFLLAYIAANILLEHQISYFQRLSMGFMFVCLLILNIVQILFYRSITKESISTITRLILLDELTEVYNYRSFLMRLQEEIARCKRRGGKFSLLFIDIDNFKNINDNLGHYIGDKVLKFVSNLLKSVLRDDDILGRMGGDEFVIILPQTDIEGAKAVCNRILKMLKQTVYEAFKQNLNIDIGLSIGITTFPEHSDIKEKLINNADEAMYMAKQSGGNRYAVYRTASGKFRKADNIIDEDLKEILDEQDNS